MAYKQKKIFIWILQKYLVNILFLQIIIAALVLLF